VVEHCYKGPGTYIVQLDAINLVTKEISYNEKTDTLVVTNIEQAYIAGPDSTETGKLIDLNAEETYLPGWNIEQYYWNFGDETVALGTKPEKVFLKPGTYNVQLIVTATSEPGMPSKETCVSKNIRIYANP
jgi:PKD repeat protein